nr:Chain B, D30 peptide [synthetic construct]
HSSRLWELLMEAT